MKVLVVDDEPILANLLGTFLRAEGYSVGVAFDGAAALQSVQSERPDVIFVDIHMPEMDGLTFARALRKLPGCQRLMLVMITGQPDLVKREQGLDIQHVLPKPFLLDDVLALLERAALADVEGPAS